MLKKYIEEIASKSSLMLSEKDYKTIFAFLSSLLFKKDGSRTKFARKYNVKNFVDFYRIFKELKKELKNDREGFAFGIIKDMAKTNVGRIWQKVPGETQEEKIFNAWSVTLDVIALILDNLKVLQKALKMMDDEYSKK